MKTLMVSSNNVKELKLLKYLARCMKMRTKIISETEMEDIGLLRAMKDGVKMDYVSEETVLKALAINKRSRKM